MTDYTAITRFLVDIAGLQKVLSKMKALELDDIFLLKSSLENSLLSGICLCFFLDFCFCSKMILLEFFVSWEVSEKVELLEMLGFLSCQGELEEIFVVACMGVWLLAVWLVCKFITLHFLTLDIYGENGMSSCPFE